MFIGPLRLKRRRRWCSMRQILLMANSNSVARAAHVQTFTRRLDVIDRDAARWLISWSGYCRR
jgi:hypothetical protein